MPPPPRLSERRSSRSSLRLDSRAKMAAYTIAIDAMRVVPKVTRRRYAPALPAPSRYGSALRRSDLAPSALRNPDGNTYSKSPALDTSNAAPVSAAMAVSALSASLTLTPAADATSPTVTLPPRDSTALSTASRTGFGTPSLSTRPLGDAAVRMTSTSVAAGDNDDARRVRARGQGGAPRRGASDKHSCRLVDATHDAVDAIAVTAHEPW
mmetsp:Transcript_1951/g.4489  ORF Transcript_1951/g.4489 Transcript_1951/m.4489 type:complete len:210 (+) Transcript_1951:1332-1961(+)